MSPDPGLPSKVLTQPRPGHADLSGMLKYGLDDARDVLERASARETAARVAAGTLAKLLLQQIGIDVLSHVVQLGPERAEVDSLPTVDDLPRIDGSQVRCADPAAEARMVAAVKAAAKEGDSLGGVAEVIAYGVPVGLGSHVHWDRRLDALLAQALMSIQAVKAVGFGDGAELAGRRGSVAHDAIRMADPSSDSGPDATAGLLGGRLRPGHAPRRRDGGRHLHRIAHRGPRGSMKPLATLNRPTLGTVDVVTKESTVSFKERTDVTAVPAMGVVAETMTALVLASEALRKFGGDSVSEFRRNRLGYLASLGRVPLGGHRSPGRWLTRSSWWE